MDDCRAGALRRSWLRHGGERAGEGGVGRTGDGDRRHRERRRRSQVCSDGRAAARCAQNIPVSGQALAHYRGQTEVVNIERLVAQTPQSTLKASGVLGVNKGDPLTSLRVDLTVRDLGEYDQLLQTLGFRGKREERVGGDSCGAPWALRLQRNGPGRDQQPGCEGTSAGDRLEVNLGTAADVQIDSVVADAEYTPRTGLAGGELHDQARHCGVECCRSRAAAKGRCRGAAWRRMSGTTGCTVNAKVQLANAQLADVLRDRGAAGQGIRSRDGLSLNGNVAGTLKNLNGGGQISLLNGVAYGEPYRRGYGEPTVQGQGYRGEPVRGEAAWDADRREWRVRHGHATCPCPC